MNTNFRKHSLPSEIAHQKEKQSGQGLVEYVLIIVVIVVVVACLVLVGVSLLWGHLNSAGRVGIILSIVGIAALAIATLFFVPVYITYLEQVVSGEMKFSDFLSMLSSQQLPESVAETGKTGLPNRPRQSHLVRTIEIVAAISGIISCLIAALALIVDIAK